MVHEAPQIRRAGCRIASGTRAVTACLQHGRDQLAEDRNAFADAFRRHGDKREAQRVGLAFVRIEGRARGEG
jgi:hypothetical protein